MGLSTSEGEVNIMNVPQEIGRGTIIALVVGLLVGLGIGLLIGYVILPVQYVGEFHSYDLKAEEQAAYVALAADSFALHRDEAAMRERFRLWYGEEMERAFAEAAADAMAAGQTQRVQYIEDLSAVLGIGRVAPAEPGAPTPEPPGAQPPVFGQILRFCGIFLAVLLVLALAYFGLRMAIQRRQEAETVPHAQPRRRAVPLPEEWEGTGQPPLGHFVTTYRLGEDAYDESFSIETPMGEFLGECGVGISEIIGVGEPDKVTAFEVWLFDKTDIRTVTKVLMSEYAFNDEALRTKLAPKGEPVLASLAEPFLLETSSLQVQIELTELEYGEGNLPANSFFDKLTVELVASAQQDGEEAASF
jgi:hypothetical protein